MCVPFKRCGVPPVRVKRNARAECTPHVVVLLSAPIDQHPYEPIPGAGGDTVGAASARQQEREIASQVLRAVEHCFRRLKAGLKVRAMASLSQYCVYALRLAACLYVYSFPSPLQATFLCVADVKLKVLLWRQWLCSWPPTMRRVSCQMPRRKQWTAHSL